MILHKHESTGKKMMLLRWTSLHKLQLIMMDIKANAQRTAECVNTVIYALESPERYVSAQSVQSQE